ncbi:MAG: cytochrome c3 family protein [Deltaproteobacteria bacterium]|nr:cytochrome c3 family protein [Deltaproteobacteria bacterium]
MRCLRPAWLLLIFLFAALANGALLNAAQAGTESVCIQCHSNLNERWAKPVEEWQGSVHALQGISCHDCHGGDSTDFAQAKSPDSGFLGAPEYTEVPEFCGRCHVGILEDYQKSAHGQAVAKGGAQCVICHGNHDVEKAHIDLINEESCTRCHDYGRAAEIKLALKETDQKIQAMEAELERVHKLGFITEDLEGALFDLRNRFHRVLHSVEVERVRQETGGVQAELTQMGLQIKEIDATMGKRKLWGSLVIAALILLGVIFLLVRKTYEEEENH